MSVGKVSSSSEHTFVLVTGVNSGLGLATCRRLVDEFLNSCPPTHQLTLIFTTRDDRKGSATLATLKKHLSHHRFIRARLPISNPRIFFRPENLELTSLRSVKALSERLLRSAVPRLDAIVLNAGLGGFVGLNWPLALWSVTTDLVEAVTRPTYKLTVRGLITQPQSPASTANPHVKEPVLGEIFCGNVFGHYMLAHWLMPLLRACPPSRPGRIIWLSSIEAEVDQFNKDDFQALESRSAYGHVKRMIDLMALTSTNEPATAKSVQAFLDPTDANDRRLSSKQAAPSKPTIHVAHPGVCATSMMPLPWILVLVMIFADYIARWIGSPWHTTSAYTGAAASVWLALADLEEVSEREKSGPAKWGSAVTRWGQESVQRTDVPQWGLSGDGEKVERWEVGHGWLGAWGRKRRLKDATKEDVERFVEDGALVWRELERLRREWEGRIAGRLENGETRSE